LIRFSRRATQQIAGLARHYETRERPDAIRNLIAAIREASTVIESDSEVGISAPRPYPQLKRPGLAWVKAGRYWIAYRRRPYLVITAVFYDAADIPGRL
jgi:plasmid stabilization system protein ParE